jgi:hypothetical protein
LQTLSTQTVPEQIQTSPTGTGWSFILDYPKPPKGLSANDRTHWRVKAGAVADIRLEVMAKTRALHLGSLDKISVQVVWVVADRRRRDTDNLAPFMKAIFDGIGADKGVSAHLVEDDDPAHMIKPGALIRYEAGVRPHFEVRIAEVQP